MKKAAGIIFRSVILLLLGAIIGILMTNRDLNTGISFDNKDKVSKVLELVRHNYVDSVNVDSIEG